MTESRNEKMDNAGIGERTLPFLIHESVSSGEDMLEVPLSWSADETELLYFREGEFKLMLGVREYEISEECICFINPGELRRISAVSEGAVEYSIRFNMNCLSFVHEDSTELELLAPLREGNTCFPRFVGISDLGNRELMASLNELLSRFRRLGERYPSIRSSERLELRAASDQLLLKAELLRLIGLMDSYGLIKERRADISDKQTEVIKQALTYIREHYNERIYNRELAELTGLNEQYFIRFFKKVMGQPPLEYINNYRIAVVKKRLLSSNGKVYELAGACGFRNIGNFIRVFRKICGMTPQQYRDELRGREKKRVEEKI